MSDLSYSDRYLHEILSETRSVALVGISANQNRPSFFVMKYLQQKGYRVFPINPGQAGKEILGETVYASLTEVPHCFELVDIFRNATAAGSITDDAIALAGDHGIKAIWMQLGIINHEAAARAEAAGLKVVMDRCPKIELERLPASQRTDLG